MKGYDVATVGKVATLAKEEDVSPLVRNARIPPGDVLEHFLLGVLVGERGAAHRVR
jgi:hypothetical protein